MSIILDAVLVCPFEDDEGVEQVNKYLYEKDESRHQQFEKMDNTYTGGHKVASMTIYQACFNHLMPDIVVGAVKQAKWRASKPVLIFDYEFNDNYDIYAYKRSWEVSYLD
jgi:hypothetical protein